MQGFDPKELKKETVRQLMNYRASKERLKRRDILDTERERLTRWVRAIASVHAMYRKTDPVRAEVMERLFGLRHPVPRNRLVRARVVRLTCEYNISEATLYRWRSEIITLVSMYRLDRKAADALTDEI